MNHNERSEPGDPLAAMTIGTALRADAIERAARVRFMLLDIDGVLTDGGLWFDGDGERLKRFHVHDGHGIKLLREAGITVGVLSGRRSAAAQTRLKELAVEHVALGVSDKLAALKRLVDAAGAQLDSTGFIGDDWVDLAVMQRVGFAATVPNAARSMREHAHWVAERAGGAGAVRDLAEFLLAARGQLAAAFAAHLDHGIAQG